MKLTPRIRGILYVVLVVAGVVTGVSQALAPDVAAEAAPVAGGWIDTVGMPAKSGVGGGVLAVLPGQLGIGVFSPRLDEQGNSVRAL